MVIETVRRDAVAGHVALAREPQLAVVLLVLDHVHEIGEHFTAVAANQNIRTACKKEWIKRSLGSYIKSKASNVTYEAKKGKKDIRLPRKLRKVFYSRSKITRLPSIFFYFLHKKARPEKKLLFLFPKPDSVSCAPMKNGSRREPKNPLSVKRFSLGRTHLKAQPEKTIVSFLSFFARGDEKKVRIRINEAERKTIDGLDSLTSSQWQRIWIDDISSSRVCSEKKTA